MVAEKRSGEEYQKHLDSYRSKTSVSTTTTSKFKISAAQPVANAAVQTQSTLPAVTNNAILPTAKCLIHPSGQHLNRNCTEQTSIRAQQLRQDSLITVIRQLHSKAAWCGQKAAVSRKKAKRSGQATVSTQAID